MQCLVNSVRKLVRGFIEEKADYTFASKVIHVTMGWHWGMYLRIQRNKMYAQT